MAGPWGVTSGDGRQFDDAPPGEVDAIEGYCLAMRREALQQVGGFDHHFRFYRNADLDLSFAVRANGWKALRTAADPVGTPRSPRLAGVPGGGARSAQQAKLLPLPEALG